MKPLNALLMTVALITASFVLATIICVSTLKDLIDSRERESAVNVASRIFDAVSSEIRSPIMVAKTMANSTFLRRQIKSRSEDEEKVYREYLESFCSTIGYNAAFVVDAETRRYYSRQGFNKVVDPEHDPHDVWYSLFLKTGKPLDLDVDRDEVDGKAWTVFINCRVDDEDGTLLGVCGVGVKMLELQRLIAAYEKDYGVKINLVNPEGLVQVDTDEINIENAVLNVGGHALDPEYRYATLSGGTYVIRRYLEDFGWYLVIRKNETSFRGILPDLLGKIVIAFIGILAVVLFVAFHLLRRELDTFRLRSDTDPLTGLLNRSAFAREAEACLSSRSAGRPGFLFFDLDGFKSVNDSLGHDEGDRILREAADILRRSFRSSDLLCRFGGDEFIVFLQDIPFDRLGSRVDRAVEAFRSISAEGCAVTVSVGGVWYALFRGADCRVMLKEADSALYEAKSLGRDRAVLRKHE